MKIYEVSHICEDDTTQHRFFTSIVEAKKAQNKLQKLEKKQRNAPDDEECRDEDFENRSVKTLFEMDEFNVDISKSGILKMLNSRFSETQ